MTTTHETPTTTTTRAATHETKTNATRTNATKTNATTDRDWFDQYLVFVKRIEAPVVRTTARMAGYVAEYVPERPAFLAALPKVHDVMTTGITLRKRMVDEQTRFARQLMKAMDPMLARVDTVHVEPERPPRAARPDAATPKRPAVRRRHEPMAHAG